jgi:hypothetical protein
MHSGKGTLNEGVPFPVPALGEGEGDGGTFSKHFNGFRGRGELFQMVQWFNALFPQDSYPYYCITSLQKFTLRGVVKHDKNGGN